MQVLKLFVMKYLATSYFHPLRFIDPQLAARILDSAERECLVDLFIFYVWF